MGWLCRDSDGRAANRGISQHGYKKSGLGTEGGLVGLLEYMEIKSVAKNKGTNRPANFMREVATAEATARL